MDFVTLLYIALGLFIFSILSMFLLPYTGISTQQARFIFINFMSVTLYTLYTYYQSDVYDQTSILVHTPATVSIESNDK